MTTDAANRAGRLSLGALKQRGWTDAGIRRFLGSPDATAPNPYYRSGPAMKLYDPARVEAVEQSAEFLAWRTASIRRKEAAQAVAVRRRAETVAAIDAVPIRLPQLGREELERLAVANRNTRSAERAERRMWRGEWDEETGWDQATVETADPAALLRWQVNYLRHRGTPYDQELSGLYAQVGKHEAAARLRARVYEEIAKMYPWLAEEARRQRSAREWTP